jgi:hypothetical protein
MLDLGGIHDRDQFARRLAVTVALLVVYRLGAHIPLPGINLQGLSHISGGAISRTSIFVLGITPLVTVLILAELLKVVAPRACRWAQANPQNAIKLNRIVVGLSLLVAVVQATGIAVALENVTGLVDEPGTRFRLITIATMVGATAIVIWLADQITRHGLGSGVWLLLASVWLVELPHQIANSVWRGPGAAVTVELALGWGAAALIIAAIVRLIRAGGRTLDTAATCLWSKLLAGTVWPWLIVLIAFVVGGGRIQNAPYWLALPRPLYLLQILLLAGLVALFVHLYMRAQRIAGSAAVSALSPAVLASGLAAITFVEMAVATQLQGFLPLAGQLILVAVVALSILARWWQPPFEADSRYPTREEA